MIYYIFYEWLFKALSAGGGGESYFVKGLNVIQYVTFRTGLAAVTALLLSLLLGGKVQALVWSMGGQTVLRLLGDPARRRPDRECARLRPDLSGPNRPRPSQTHWDGNGEAEPL